MIGKLRDGKLSVVVRQSGNRIIIDLMTTCSVRRGSCRRTIEESVNMKKRFKAIAVIMTGSLLMGAGKNEQHVIWELDNLEEIGGHKVTVEGEPKVIDTPHGKALEFDGVDDGIFLDVHPLAGMTEFTVEVIFQPYADGQPEQRFFPYAGRRNNRTRDV